MTDERIVYLKRNLFDSSSFKGFQEIGKTDNGTYGSMPGNRLLEYRQNGYDVPLLFLTTNEMNTAVAELSPMDVVEVIKRRIENAKQTEIQGQSWLASIERKIFYLICETTSGNDESWQALSPFVQTTIQRLSMLNSWHRGRELDEFIQYLIECEYRLQAELDEIVLQMQTDNLQCTAQTLEEVAIFCRNSAAFGSKALAELGDDAYIDSPAHIIVEQGYFVTPRDERLETRLKKSYAPFIRWEEGIIANISRQTALNFQNEGKSTRLLFVSGNELLSMLSSLTVAQQKRDINARLLNNAPLSLQMMSTFIGNATMLLSECVAASMQAHMERRTAVADLLNKEMESGLGAVRLMYKIRRCFNCSNTVDINELQSQVLMLEKSVLDGASLFAVLIRLHDDNELSDFFNEYSQLKKTDISVWNQIALNK